MKTKLALIISTLFFTIFVHAHAIEKITNQDEFFNFDTIYNPNGYSYSLPRADLEKYLAGNAFGRSEIYAPEKQLALRDDLWNIFCQNVMVENPCKERVAYMTAGAPGSGKTILLEHVREQTTRDSGLGYAYSDPDAVFLKNMALTFKAAEATSDRSVAARLALYNEWRPGSNAGAHLALAHLIKEGYAFFFGTTSTGPFTFKFLELLKKHEYKIKLIYISAPDDVRVASIRKRDQDFVQTTDEDIQMKGKLLPQRIHDTYLKFADEIDFYYRSGVSENAVFAAKWIRNEQGAYFLGTLTIDDHEAYENIVKIHNGTVETLTEQDFQDRKKIPHLKETDLTAYKASLLWENSVQACSKRADEL